MSEKSDHVRVRFAPSPTGYLHIGALRAGLFNWLHARHTGGKFLLRIEDTDVERSTEEATRQIIDSLEWLGITPDEPIEYQTRRAAIHREYLDKLLAAGSAYRDYCPKERLEELRGKARDAGTIFAYRKTMFPDAEAQRLEAEGAPFVIRFPVPDEGVTGFDDFVYGHIEVQNSAIGDFVIARGDGSPLYNFTNVVDDVDMRVSLICRGEDHVSNTPKQILIYRALGVEPPQFAHLPLILGTDKKKLSKRHGATGVDQFRDLGIVPEALINFLALLGWAPSEAEFNEVMPLEELVRRFTLDRVNKSPAVFDYEKLLWMNGVYIREMPREKLYPQVARLLEQRFPEAFAAIAARQEWLHAIIDLAVERSRTLNEFADNLDYFFRVPTEYDAKAMKKQLGSEEAVRQLRSTGEQLSAHWDAMPDDSVDAWAAGMEEPLRAWADSIGAKFGNIAQPVRLAVTGRTASPPLFHVLHLLGKDEVLRRIEACADRATTELAPG
jgi:glutamyl-tRNA synthetase